MMSMLDFNKVSSFLVYLMLILMDDCFQCLSKLVFSFNKMSDLIKTQHEDHLYIYLKLTILFFKFNHTSNKYGINWIS